MHDVRGRIENFIKHCHMHGLGKDIDNKMMLQLVHNKLMSQNQLTVLYTENSVNHFIAKMDTLSMIVEWLTRKITAIRYAQEGSTKVFDPVVEIKKVNLASAEASLGQNMAQEDLVVDFSSTALITQFRDDEADFKEEYDEGHPDNYNQKVTVEDDSGSDTEKFKENVMYNKTEEKLEYKKSERKTQVIPPCPLCLSKGETKMHWLIKCETLMGQEPNERHKTIQLLVLCKNCFSRDHKARDCTQPSKCRVEGCDYRHHTMLNQIASERNVARAAADNVRTSYINFRQ
jgi:hypothetical protein